MSAPHRSAKGPVPPASPRPSRTGGEGKVSPETAGQALSPDIFRAYDIRGVVGDTLTDDAVYRIARAFATDALAAGKRRVAVGGDGRNTTAALRRQLLRGLHDGGVGAIDIGCVPTPLLYYATHVLDTATGIMVTGSHNPPEYNGLKMVLDGSVLAGERIQGLRKRIEAGAYSAGAFTPGDESHESIDLVDRYIEHVVRNTSAPGGSPPRLKVVADCGNGVAGLVAPRLLTAMGCEVVPLYADVDGTFPNHHPDPADAANLADLIAAVEAEGADLGVAFDGDGDRLGVVTDLGEIIWPDRQLMLFSDDVIGRNPGARVVFDVKCSRHLATVIRDSGGCPIMWKTGHSHIKAKIRDTGALLGGEFSGHICFADRWFGFDDAIYSAARLVQILRAAGRPASEVFAGFPDAVATPEIKVPTTEQAKFEIMARLANASAHFEGGTVTTIDGVRVDYADGWGLARASNTSPVLSLRFEADHPEALTRIQGVFRDALAAADPTLSFEG